MLNENTLKVYAIIYEDPEIFNFFDDDICRELFGIYSTRQEAESVLRDLKQGKADAHLYSIEEWEDDIPF